MLGQFFFLLFFVFSLTCYRVFFYFSLSGILLITLLCYVLYVNFVIVCYLAPIYYQFLRVYLCNNIRRSRLSFSSVALTTDSVILSIWNLLFLWFGNSKTLADCEFTCCVLELALARSLDVYKKVFQKPYMINNPRGGTPL